MTNGLPLLNKLLYTTDMIGGQAVVQTRNLWLLFFLAPPRGEGDAAVPALSMGPFDIDARVFVGGLLTAGRLIEALDDPIVGWWSDRTRSRWGRRLPFVVFSTPFWAIFFMLLWFSPVEGASFVNALWVFVILELFFLSNTASIGPYESLLPEVARTHRDRMSIVAWQFYFGILGAVLGLVLSGVVQDTWGFKVMGILIGVFGLGFRFLGVAGIWRHAPRDTPPAEMPLKQAFFATLANRQFLYFVPTFVLFQLATTMTLGWMPFFVSAVLESENEGTVTSMLTGTALVGMMVAVVVLWQMGNTRGKRWVYSVCLLGTAAILPILFFVGFIPGIPKLAQGIVIAFLVGLPMGGVNLMPRAHHGGHRGLRRDTHGNAPGGDVLHDTEPVREVWLLVLDAGAGAHPAARRDGGRPAGHTPAGANRGGDRAGGLLRVQGLPVAKHRDAGERTAGGVVGNK